MSARRARVGIVCDVRELGAHRFHVVGDKYLRAVAEASDCLPLLLPALGGWYDWTALLDDLDGLFLTGSPSNVHPARYGAGVEASVEPHDPARDQTTLPLMAAALDRGLPLFAVCRGFQELNVALGGTLHPRVHEVPGLQDHREDKDAAVDLQYGPAHPVSVVPGGLLEGIVGPGPLTVNSLHGQGIDALAPGLRVEATAPDGLVEAVSVSGHPFALAVQWHPEWRVRENRASLALFKAFGAAVRQRKR